MYNGKVNDPRYHNPGNLMKQLIPKEKPWGLGLINFEVNSFTIS